MYHYSLSYATFGNLEHLKYRKIPKMSPGAYIFQRPFLRGLLLKGAYIRRGLPMGGNLRFKV